MYLIKDWLHVLATNQRLAACLATNQRLVACSAPKKGNLL